MDNRIGRRQLIADGMVVGHDQPNAKFPAELRMSNAGDPAIDRDDDLFAALGQLANGILA